MHWIEQTITDFGHSVGIDALSLNDAGVVMLTFERLGTLFIERREMELLVYLVRELTHPTAATFRAALEACHYRHQHPFPVQAGLRGDRHLVFLARLPAADFILPNLERTVALLDQIHNGITS